MDLPGEMNRNRGHKNEIAHTQIQRIARPGPEHHSGRIKPANPLFALITKADGRRLEPQAEIILNIDIDLNLIIAYMPGLRPQPHRNIYQRHGYLRICTRHAHSPYIEYNKALQTHYL